MIFSGFKLEERTDKHHSSESFLRAEKFLIFLMLRKIFLCQTRRKQMVESVRRSQEVTKKNHVFLC